MRAGGPAGEVTRRRRSRFRTRWLPGDFISSAWGTPGVVSRFVWARLAEVVLVLTGFAAGVQTPVVFILWAKRRVPADPDREWATGILLVEILLLFALRALAASVMIRRRFATT